jgi:hypothetical protein
MSAQNKTTTKFKVIQKPKPSGNKCVLCERTDCVKKDQWGHWICSDYSSDEEYDPNGNCEQCKSSENVDDYWWCEEKNEKWRLCRQCGIDEDQERCETFEEKEKKILDKIEINVEDAIALFGDPPPYE